VAYHLIQHNNPDRLEVQEDIDKALESTIASDKKSIFMLQFDTLSFESDRIAELILEKAKEGYQYRDMAILVRRNADADPYLRALNMKEIPFRFSGSRGLYAKREVKTLVSFIKALTDFEDSKSLFFLALSEIYGIDAYDLTLLSNYAGRKNINLHRIFKNVFEGNPPVDISKESEHIVRQIFEDLLFFIRQASSQNAGRVLYSFLEKTNTLRTLAEKKDIQSEVKVKNIRIFFDKIKNFSDLSEDDSVFSFAKHLELLQQVGDNPAAAEAELDEDAVNVLTIHKAKGLEFLLVFMVGLIADRFPGRVRQDKIPIPDKILKEEFLERRNFLQEERRLFYVGMTRAKKWIYLTWARDYGLKRLKKVSPFVLEALNLSKAPDETLIYSAVEEIKRYAPPAAQPESRKWLKEDTLLDLSFYQVDDYVTCPQKYKYRHILRVPVLPDHNLVYGRVLHNSIHFYLKNKMAGKRITEKDLLKEYKALWVNEGFLSREHEEMRKKEGEKALRLFFRREEVSGQLPLFLEKEFRWHDGNVRFRGRWDRIDQVNGKAVIIDYKSTKVKDQKEADKRTQDSLQMDIYALSFTKTQDMPILESRLLFLESDIAGRAEKKQRDLNRAMENIQEAEAGIRKKDFHPKPDWHNCNFCSYKNICASSFAY
jgi:DNA helicase-2/ATP-dependent DNA helicase PcrA